MLKIFFRVLVTLGLFAIGSIAFAYTPIENDPNTLLLLNFNNTLNEATGQAPNSSSNTSYAAGITGNSADSSLVVGSNTSLSYSTTNNFNLSSGTIEFWIKPSWNGNNGQNNVLWNMGNYQTNDHAWIIKDSNANLRFVLGNDFSPNATNYNISNWVANQWHHITVTWQFPGQMNLYIDGKKLVTTTTSAQRISNLPNLMDIGSYYNSTWQANATIDAFSISSDVRTDEEITLDDVSNLNITNLDITSFFSSMYPTWEQTPISIKVTTTNAGTIDLPTNAAIWSSSNTSIASVDSATGKILALTAGNVDLIATLKTGSVTASKPILVKSPILPINKKTPAEIAALGFTEPSNDALFVIPVVVIKYVPIIKDANNNNIADPATTDGGIYSGKPLAETEQFLDTNLLRSKEAREEGSRYHLYSNANAQPAIGFKIVDYITVYEEVPGSDPTDTGSAIQPYADIAAVFNRFNGTHYVNDLGVKEFWVVYDGGPSTPTQSASFNGKPLSNEHSRLRSEGMNVSPVNGYHYIPRSSDPSHLRLPVLNQAYLVMDYDNRTPYWTYTHATIHYAYEGRFAETDIAQDGNQDIFWQKFVGTVGGTTDPYYQQSVKGRCGWAHTPFNFSLTEPDSGVDPFNSPLYTNTDCRNWEPNGGVQESLNSDAWMNSLYSNWLGTYPSWYDGDGVGERALGQFYEFWFQSLPGLNNTNHYPAVAENNNVDSHMTNWWQMVGAWDTSRKAGIGLYEPATCTYSLSSSNQIFDSFGGSTSITVNTGLPNPLCKWIAVNNEPTWITFNTDGSGNLLDSSANGNTTASFTVAANVGSSRTGTVAIANHLFTITQLSSNPGIVFNFENVADSVTATLSSRNASCSATNISSTGVSTCSITNGYISIRRNNSNPDMRICYQNTNLPNGIKKTKWNKQNKQVIYKVKNLTSNVNLPIRLGLSLIPNANEQCK